jgi:hypothetical protein
MMSTGSPSAVQPALAAVEPRPAGAGAPRRRRFTLDGDDALEQHLERTCARIVSGIRGLIPPRKLEAVLLAGGYGRGEGGVLRGTAGDRPYNDLEFYVAIKGWRHLNDARYRRRLEVLGEILTHLADAEVEFKITSLAALASSPVTMFSYDLAAGHRLLWSGAPGDLVLDWGPHLHPENIPQAEATRLLMNRCSGLLFARARLEQEPFTPPAADFVRRNVAKAQLACGDALLAAHGQYHWNCRERHRRLENLARSKRPAWFDAALRHHALGVGFKLHPVAGAIPRDALFAEHGEITALAMKCWLWLEARRLGRAFPSARAYAEDAHDVCPGSSPFFNILLNLRADGFRLRAKPRPWRHPRQRLFRSLSLLLWEPGATDEPALKRRIQAELNTRASSYGECVAAYRDLWQRVR